MRARRPGSHGGEYSRGVALASTVFSRPGHFAAQNGERDAYQAPALKDSVSAQREKKREPNELAGGARRLRPALRWTRSLRMFSVSSRSGSIAAPWCHHRRHRNPDPNRHRHPGRLPARLSRPSFRLGDFPGNMMSWRFGFVDRVERERDRSRFLFVAARDVPSNAFPCGFVFVHFVAADIFVSEMRFSSEPLAQPLHVFHDVTKFRIRLDARFGAALQFIDEEWMLSDHLVNLRLWHFVIGQAFFSAPSPNSGRSLRVGSTISDATPCSWVEPPATR